MDLDRIAPPASDTDARRWLNDLGLEQLIDMHVHFLPERVQVKVWDYFEQGEQTFGHAWPIMYRYDEADRVNILREIGVSHFVPLVYPHKPDMAAWLNSWVREFVARTPEAILTATMYPEPGVGTYVRDTLEAGARCVKVHVAVGRFDPRDPLLSGAWDLLAEAEVPVVVHCGHGLTRTRFTGLDIFAEVLAQHPNLTAVLAHAGMPDYREALELVRRYDRVHIDTTLIGTPYIQQIAPLPQDWPTMLADRGLEDRIVFGTDYPNLPYPYVDQLRAIHNWASADERLGIPFLHRVLYGNPARLLKIGKNRPMKGHD